MKRDSEWAKYPFGILQKVYMRITIGEQHLSKGICMNIDCDKRVGGDKEYCGTRCYEKVKYERSVAGSWKE